MRSRRSSRSSGRNHGVTGIPQASPVYLQLVNIAVVILRLEHEYYTELSHVSLRLKNTTRRRGGRKQVRTSSSQMNCHRRKNRAKPMQMSGIVLTCLLVSTAPRVTVPAGKRRPAIKVFPFFRTLIKKYLFSTLLLLSGRNVDPATGYFPGGYYTLC